jgi:uncharacterized protein YjiS (DUF1127 family)
MDHSLADTSTSLILPRGITTKSEELQMFASLARTVAISHPAAGISLFSLHSLWKSRQDLARLDARRLADLGLSPAEAAAESQRPLWDVPHTWKR